MTVPAGALLRDRAVVAALVTTLASAGAAVTQVTALGITLYDLTGRDLDLGLLGLAEFLPAILLVLVTGPVADRFDRRRLITLGLLGEVVCAGALVALSMAGNRATGPIFAVVVVFGVARAFLSPATRSLSADNAPVGGLPRMVAFNSAAWQVALIGGPVLAGALYLVGPTWPFVACMVIAAVGAVSAAFTRAPGERRPLQEATDPVAGDPGTATLVDLVDVARPAETVDHLPAATGAIADHGSADGSAVSAPVPPAPLEPVGRLREAAEGLVVIRRRPILLGAISLDMFAVLFGGAVALLPALAEKRLGVDAGGVGWLRAAVGIGAATMTLWLTIRPVQRRVGRWLFTMVTVFGLGTIVLGLTRSFAVAFVALVVLSAADAVSVYIRSTIVPLVTPPESRGRVLAVEGVFVGASNELGAFESGVVGALLGTGLAVVTGGVATLGVVVVWVTAFPALRRIDRFSDLHPRPHDGSRG